MNPEFVMAYAKSTGVIQPIPADWVDHPVLGADFELTPSQRGADADNQPTGPLSEDWTVPQLKAYAAAHAINLDGATRKADVWATIQAAFVDVSGRDPIPAEPTPGDGTPQDPDANPAADNTAANAGTE